MVVCRDCCDVVGPFFRLYGARAGEGPLLQRGSCDLHPPRAHAPRWPGFDFNRGVDLCYCCAIEPLTSGSRWSTWFCPTCRPLVDQLNADHGRCVVPIGRHSAHHGSVLRTEDAADPVAVQLFNDAAKAAAVATMALADWRAIAVTMNLDALGTGVSRAAVIPYWRELTDRVDHAERFRNMCAYLDRRGRAAFGRRKGAGR